MAQQQRESEYFDAYQYLVEVDFPELVKRACELRGQMEEAKEELDDIKNQIGAALDIAGAGTVDVDTPYGEAVVFQSHSEGRWRLDKKKLVELGVQPEVIRKASVQGKAYSSVTVKMKKEKE